MSFVDPIFACDFYKVSHYAQYPVGTELIYSNFTPRSNKLAGSVGSPECVVFFGLQGFIKSFLMDLFTEKFFDQPKSKVIEKYTRRCNSSLGEGAVTVEHIAALYDLGYLPIEIKALPEGSLVPVKVPVLTIKNTLPEFYWLTNYLETALSAELWKPITTATTAYEYRKLLERFAHQTGAALEFVDWQAHDFSLRGQSNLYDGASCAGHLTSFLGTDTIPAIDYLEEYYSGLDTFVGGSVSASEHSVMCAGSKDSEIETIRRLINEVTPTGIVSIVSDTWDFWRVMTEYTVVLKNEILNRPVNALGQSKVVFRPDSGDPVKILTGYDLMGSYKTEQEFYDYFGGKGYLLDEYSAVKIGDRYYAAGKIDPSRVGYGPELSAAEVKGAVQCLWDVFGGTYNTKGYKELDSHVGLIYGDSITIERAKKILTRLMDHGFASSNVVFGIGSYTYQYVTRDTFGFAMKCTYTVRNGEGHELFKDPVTDSGTKKSARGLLRVERENDEYVLYDQQTREQESMGCLETVFVNGNFVKETTLAQIRERLKA